MFEPAKHTDTFPLKKQREKKKEKKKKFVRKKLTNF
jgi:hypothetical protein